MTVAAFLNCESYCTYSLYCYEMDQYQHIKIMVLSLFAILPIDSPICVK